MDIESLRLYCLSKKGAEESFPFDQDTLVFKIMGKMFACLHLENARMLTVKCNPDYALELREKYSEIECAYHFNKKYWNQIDFTGSLDEKFVEHLIDHSVDEVYKKFTRKMKDEYDRMQ